MKNRVLRSGFLFGGLLLALATSALPQGTSSFTTFEVPAAGTGALQGTTVIGIDTAGDVAGTYIDANSVYHGFVRAANGVITTFDAPGAGMTKGLGTLVLAMDTVGDVTGYYSAAPYGLTHGFVRTANGVITSFDATTSGGNTAATGINSLGAVTGNSYGPGGFVRSAGGAISTFAIPVPGQSYSYSTAGIAINTAGVVAGDTPLTASTAQCRTA
jgi:hypothetical protein